MCARFPLVASAELIERLFDVELPDEREERFNIAPTQNILAVVEHESGREAHTYRWGLVPHWSKTSGGPPLINLRRETLLERPTYKKALERRRCVIPCTGFYEWRTGDEPPSQDLFGSSEAKKKVKKQPLLFYLPNEPITAFAGIYERWSDPLGKDLYSCTIITGPSNTVVAPYHDRMPCLLKLDQVSTWLNRDAETPELIGLLDTLSETQLQVKEVDPSINNSKTEAELAESQAVY